MPNDHFTATKNPHWRPGMPHLDSITYKPIPDPDQLLATFQSGGVDIMHTDTANMTKTLGRHLGRLHRRLEAGCR